MKEGDDKENNNDIQAIHRESSDSVLSQVDVFHKIHQLDSKNLNDVPMKVVIDP